MSEWEISTFEAFVNKGELSIQTGPFGTQLKASDYAESGTPVINVRNIGFGIIIDDNIEYIADETRDKLSSHILKKDDIVFGRKGAVERHAFVDQKHDGWLQGSDCIRVRIESPTLRPRYASYCLLTPAHKTWMANNCSHGATMASLNQDIVKRIEIPVPEMQVQDQVISMLSAYDDLIENNNRRIAILEEMAQKLYREWFVHFRFPGHENVKMVESAVGLTPADWRNYCVADIARFIKGKKPSDITNDQQAGYVKNILLDAIASGEYKFVNPQKMVLVEPNDIIMVMDGASSGKVFSGECGAVGSTLAKISTPDEYRFVLFMYLASHESSIMDNNTGSAIPHANKDFVNMMRLTIPNDGLLARFNNIIGEYMHEKQLLRNKNMNLRKTRDLLLPRLISGDIDVSELDIPIKEG